MTRLVPRDTVTAAHVSTLPPGVTAYTHDGCRCRGCRDAQADYMAETRAAYRNRDLYPVRHGTLDGYTNHSCRCADCTDVRRKYDQKRRASS